MLAAVAFAILPVRIKELVYGNVQQGDDSVEQQKVLHVRVYKGDIVVFESEYPEQKLWEEEIPANEYEWMDFTRSNLQMVRLR